MMSAMQAFAAAETNFNAAVQELRDGRRDEKTARETLEQAFHNVKIAAGKAIADDATNVHARLATVVNTMRDCRRLTVESPVAQPAADIADLEIFRIALAEINRINESVTQFAQLLATTKNDAERAKFDRVFQHRIKVLGNLLPLLQGSMRQQLREELIKLSAHYEQIIGSNHQTHKSSEPRPSLVMGLVNLAVIAAILYGVYSVFASLMTDWIGVAIVAAMIMWIIVQK